MSEILIIWPGGYKFLFQYIIGNCPRSWNENLSINYSYPCWCRCNNLYARNSIHLDSTIGHTSKGVLAWFFHTLVWTWKIWLWYIYTLLLKCELNRIWSKITSANIQTYLHYFWVDGKKKLAVFSVCCFKTQSHFLFYFCFSF